MHWLLHLLVDAGLVAGLAAAYCAYQEHRRKQSEYARVQLYEDADKPCALPPLFTHVFILSQPYHSPITAPLYTHLFTHPLLRAASRVHPPPARPPPARPPAARLCALPTPDQRARTSFACRPSAVRPSSARGRST